MEELTSKLVAPEIELISKQLSSLDKEASKLEKVILISTGSFNPVHKMHIELFSLSIEELEKKRSKVVACILAPASDEYVQAKLGKEAIPFIYREKLIHLTAKHSSPFYDLFIVSKAESHLQHVYDDAIVFYQKLVQEKFPKEKIRVKFVCGADHGRFIAYSSSPVWAKDGVIVINRKNYLINKANLPVWILLIEDSSKNSLMNQEISSTKLRRLKEQASDLTYPQVMEYLRHHKLLGSCKCGGRWRVTYKEHNNEPSSNCTCL